MLRFAMSFRLIMLFASFGAAVGALLMFWEGGAKIAMGARSIAVGDDGNVVIASVMSGMDGLLLGIVLVIFAYAIAFGFVFDLPPEERDKLPLWMRPRGVNELKETLVSVILVYLVVDFATDWPLTQTQQGWEALAKPISILLIAAAFRLFAASHATPPHERDG